jgi:multicomponent Na+:H+ antiporter subunit F
MLLAGVRLIRGPSLPDRVVALDLVVTIAVGILAAYAVIMRDVAILDAGIVAALIAFLGTVAFASYLERGGRR